MPHSKLILRNITDWSHWPSGVRYQGQESEGSQMRSHSLGARAILIAVATLATASLIVGMGVNPTRAGSNLPSAVPTTPISSEVVPPTAIKPIKPHSTLLIRRTVPTSPIDELIINQTNGPASRWRLSQAIPNYCFEGFLCPHNYICQRVRVNGICVFQCMRAGVQHTLC